MKFKKLLVLTLSITLLFGIGNAWAGDCLDCDAQATADVQPAVGIHGSISIVPGGWDLVIGWPTSVVQDPASNGSGNFGTADVILNADASATGMDKVKMTGYEYFGDGEKGDPGWYQHKSGWTQYKQGGTNGKSWTFLGEHRREVYETIPGVSEAFGRNQLTLTSDVDIHSNSPQTSGLAYTGVHATTMLDIDGVAWAEGTDGCPQ